MNDPKPVKFSVVVWQPFFDRGRFRYWKDVGRGVTIIDKDGKPQTDFYYDAHATGGSIWTRVLPEGKAPKGLPDDEQEKPKRSTTHAEHDE